MHHFLITGASGFVGAQLALLLRQSGHQVTGISYSHAIPAELHHIGVTSRNVNLLDAESVTGMLHEVSPSAILHCAALADSAVCERDPALARALNEDMTRLLIESCAHACPDIPVVLMSTDLVYDGGSAPPSGFRETDPPIPASIYGQSKARSEAPVLRYCSGYVMRLSLVYGTPLSGTGGFLKWMLDAVEEGKELNLFTDEWRSPVFSADIARAVDALATKPDSFPRLLHVGGPERVSRFEFGEILCKTLRIRPIQLVARLRAEVPSVVTRPADVSLNTSLLRSLGLIPTSPRDALAQIVALMKPSSPR